MFSQSSTKSKLVVAIILLVIFLLLYIGLLLLSRYGEQRIVLVNDTVKAMEMIQKKKENTQEFLTKTEKTRTDIASYVLSDERLVEFIEYIETSARQAGVSEATNAVTDVSYPSVDAERWGGVMFSITSRGSWDDTFQFLSLLERLPYKSHLTRVVLTQDVEEGQKKSKEFWRGDFALLVLKKK